MFREPILRELISAITDTGATIVPCDLPMGYLDVVVCRDRKTAQLDNWFYQAYRLNDADVSHKYSEYDVYMLPSLQSMARALARCIRGRAAAAVATDDFFTNVLGTVSKIGENDHGCLHLAGVPAGTNPLDCLVEVEGHRHSVIETTWEGDTLVILLDPPAPPPSIGAKVMGGHKEPAVEIQPEGVLVVMPPIMTKTDSERTGATRSFESDSGINLRTTRCVVEGDATEVAHDILVGIYVDSSKCRLLEPAVR